MSRRLFQCAVLLVLVFATLTPLANCFDTWDKSTPPSNDTEIQVTALFICAGFMLVVPKLLRRLLKGAPPQFNQLLATNENVPHSCRTRPVPSASPPLIALRI